MRYLNRNKIEILIFLIFFICVSYVNAFKTYTEKVNPFNKFMDPTDGVDLYSGNVAFTKTLYEMKGRNGLDIGINLKYSSNVYLNARAKNDKAPSSWVGLGWSLSYGSIRRDHKGTTNKVDDEYHWVSPEGYTKKIIVKFDINEDGTIINSTNAVKWSIEDFPYIKVICSFQGDDPNNNIIGWTLYMPDGTKLHYGNYNNTDGVRFATRYTFAVNGGVQPQISQVSAEMILLYPYQWDLSDIEDNFNNHITFEYWQDEETVKSLDWKDYSDYPIIPEDAWEDAWETDQFYTKASYPSIITNPEGEQIIFGRIDKNEDEYYDPHRFSIPSENDAWHPIDGYDLPVGREPDAFIEMFERYLLGSIQIKNAKGVKIKEFVFTYKPINLESWDEIKAHYFRKSLLSKITEYNGGAHNEDNEFNVDIFSYYDDITKADDQKRGTTYRSGYNYGALWKHVNSLGYVAVYDYARIDIDGAKAEFLNTIKANATGKYINIASGRITSTDCPFFVFTFKNTESEIDSCFVYNWNGAKWVKYPIFGLGSLNEMYCQDTSIGVVAGNDYFTLLGGRSDTKDTRRFCVYNWNETTEDWEKDMYLPGAEEDEEDGLVDIESDPEGVWADPRPYKAHVRLIGMPEYFVLLRNNNKAQPNAYISIWNRLHKCNVYDGDVKTNKKWMKSDLTYIWYTSGGADVVVNPKKVFTNDYASNFDKHYIPLQLLVASNYIAFFGESKKNQGKEELIVFNWDGFKWESKKQLINAEASFCHYYTDYIFYTGNNSNWFAYLSGTNLYPSNFGTYMWDGNSWIKTTRIPVYNQWNSFWGTDLRYNPVMSSPFDIISSESWDFKINRWNGYSWQKSIKEGDGDIGLDWKPMLNSKYCVFLGGNHSARILQWDNYINYWSFNKIQFSGSWYWGLQHINNPTIDMLDDFFITHSDCMEQENRPPLYKNGANVIMWDGRSGWEFLESVYYNKSSGITKSGFYIKNTASTHDAIAFIYDNPGTATALIALRYKFQNSIENQIYTYVVTDKRIKSGFSQKEISLGYDYENDLSECETCNCCGDVDENGTYDTKNGTAKFNKVTVTLANGSKVTNYYFNDLGSQDGENVDFDKLDGLMYSSRSVSDIGNTVAEQNTKYKVHIASDWLAGIYEKQVVKNITKLDAVETVVEKNYTLNSGSLDINGQPRYVYMMNSDGRKITDYTLFAHEHVQYKTQFINSNFLSQPCLTLSLEDHDIPVSPGAEWYDGNPKVRSAQATKWASFNGTLAPSETYSWNVEKDSYGTPETVFDAFEFSSGASNPDWQFQRAFTKYNNHGQVLEVEALGASSGSRIPASTIYRSDMAMNIGQVINAKFDECAVFTCDYNYNEGDVEDGYFDIENGWEIGVQHTSPAGICELSSSPTHFGQKSIYVYNSEGPTNKIHGIQLGKDYVFSAWVFLTNGDGITLGVQIKGSGTDLLKTFNVTQIGEWQLIVNKIPKEDLASFNPGNDFLKIWIGNLNGSQQIPGFYVDDIRFYPEDALVTTTYYDQLWEKPILIVDANNNPGKKIDIGSFYDKKDISKYSGNIGFQPSDALKINLFHDEVWKSSAYKDKTIEGKIEYDDFGRPVRWYKFNHNPDQSNGDTLIMEKEYHTAGVNPVSQECRMCDPNRETDSLVLCAFYKSTNGENWTNNTNWCSENTIDIWYGVTVAGDRVKEVNLNSNNLTGTIHSDIGYLDNLQKLILNDNNLTGKIPPEVEGMIDLRWLYLHNNDFEGRIPHSLGNCTSLRRLYLYGNNLQGSIPSELLYITSLEELLLQDNQLSGLIPVVLSNLVNLQKLHLNDNALIGAIPGEFGVLANLLELFVQNNSLSYIGEGIVFLPAFTVVDLDNNNFCLLHPAIEDWADEKDPNWQASQNCNFREIDSLALVSMYYTLDGANWTNTWNLGDEITTWYGVTVTSGRITQIALSNNNLIGEMLPVMSNMRQLQSLDLSNNTISGSIPSLEYIEGLTSLQLQNNELSSLDDGVLIWTSLTTLDLGNNALCLLTPELEDWATTYDPDWQSSQECNYRKIDSLALAVLHKSTGGANWTNTWDLSTQVTSWYGVTVSGGRVTHIQLGNNNLNGFLHYDIGNMRQLQELSVQSNNLSGTVPSSFAYISTLITLQVQNNQLTNLGDRLVDLTGVTTVDLGYNKLCELSAELQTWATSKDPDWESTQVCE